MGVGVMRVIFTISVFLLMCIGGCDRRYINCFEAELPKARESQTCNDLWQVCEKQARQTAEATCAEFKPKD
jgi:hypothetical protein